MQFEIKLNAELGFILKHGPYKLYTLEHIVHTIQKKFTKKQSVQFDKFYCVTYYSNLLLFIVFKIF